MSELLEQLARDGSVPLERYGHQVGGHYLMFKFKDTLCKPVIPREHFFYQTAPREVKRYMPTYYGELKIVINNLYSPFVEYTIQPYRNYHSQLYETAIWKDPSGSDSPR